MVGSLRRLPVWLKGLSARLNIDALIFGIICAVLVAIVLPAKGDFVPVLDWIVKIAIALLFFLYGGRMHPREALDGLKHWRLHLTILGFTFVVFPLIGLALWPIAPHIIGDDLYTGVLYMCLIPSTVQSSIAFTSIAHGNVAGAIVSASASNLIGVFLTPLLAIALISSAGHVQITGSAILDIALQLFVPFVLGQLLRGARLRPGGSTYADFLERNAKPSKIVDRGSIILVVYSAFSAGMREHIWSQVQWWQIIVLIVGAIVLVAFMLWLTIHTARVLGFDRGDSIAIQFCGTKKSLATGLPMATVMFAGQPVGLIVLPLMIFHQVQLMICAALASRYDQKYRDEHPDIRDVEVS